MRPDQRVPSLRPLVVPPSKAPKQRPSPWWLALPVAFPLLLVAAVSALAARRRIRSRRAEEARMAELEAGLQEIVAEARAARRSVER